MRLIRKEPKEQRQIIINVHIFDEMILTTVSGAEKIFATMANAMNIASVVIYIGLENNDKLHC